MLKRHVARHHRLWPCAYDLRKPVAHGRPQQALALEPGRGRDGKDEVEQAQVKEREADVEREAVVAGVRPGEECSPQRGVHEACLLGGTAAGRAARALSRPMRRAQPRLHPGREGDGLGAARRSRRRAATPAQRPLPVPAPHGGPGAAASRGQVGRVTGRHRIRSAGHGENAAVRHRPPPSPAGSRRPARAAPRPGRRRARRPGRPRRRPRRWGSRQCRPPRVASRPSSSGISDWYSME